MIKNINACFSSVCFPVFGFAVASRNGGKCEELSRGWHFWVRDKGAEKGGFAQGRNSDYLTDHLRMSLGLVLYWETPAAWEEGNDWSVSGNSGLKRKGQGSPTGSLIQAHTDCSAIFCDCFCSVQTEGLDKGPSSGMESAELTGIEWRWRWCFLQGVAGLFINPEHSHMCKVPGGAAIVVHTNPFPPVFSGCLICPVSLEGVH